jgi:hypothetical protein
MPSRSHKTLTDLSETNRHLESDNAALETVGRLALELAARQSANMAKVGAMARAIARSDVPEEDRSALAATLQQLAEHCECEAEEHLQKLRSANQSRRASTSLELVDDDEDAHWMLIGVPFSATH